MVAHGAHVAQDLFDGCARAARVFGVTIATDQNKEQVTEAIYAFGAKLRKRGGVGFFYSAGHGMEISGAT